MQGHYSAYSRVLPLPALGFEVVGSFGEGLSGFQ